MAAVLTAVPPHLRELSVSVDPPDLACAWRWRCATLDAAAAEASGALPPLQALQLQLEGRHGWDAPSAWQHLPLPAVALAAEEVEVEAIGAAAIMPLAGSAALLGSTRLRRLPLARLQLDAPPAVLVRAALRSLDLVECQTDHAPANLWNAWCGAETLGQLSRLTRLVLVHFFCAPPADFDYARCLPQLRELWLGALEGLTSLPEGIRALQHLTMLDLSCNELAALPEGPYLSRLRGLNLAGNPIWRLPAVLSTGATALEVLDLSGTRLTARSTSLPLLAQASMPRLHTVHYHVEACGEAGNEWEVDDDSSHNLEDIQDALNVVTAMQRELGRRRPSRPGVVDLSRRLDFVPACRTVDH
ncbi:hypothetical protein ABPG75_011007 [Micractinium tetrahymenae]